MDTRGRQKKMRWRRPILCWRRAKQAKRDLEMRGHPSDRENSAVSAFEEHDRHKQFMHYPDHYPYYPEYPEPKKVLSGREQNIARSVSTKRTSSSSAAGKTAETKSTQADSSTETPSSDYSHHRYQSQVSRPTKTRNKSKRRPSGGHVKPKRTLTDSDPYGPGAVPHPQNNMYVAVEHDSETITALSMPDMDGDYYEEDSRLSEELPPRSLGSRSGPFSDDGYVSFQSHGFLEATILRCDSDSSKDMSAMGEDFHVSVYNLSERMNYDIREAGRSLSTFAGRLTQSCVVSPKLIKD